MKLLLTSAGLTNDLIVDALRDLVGKNFDEVSVAFIPTASNVESGDKFWVINDLIKLQELKFELVDIVDISALQPNMVLERLQAVDILFFEGGNSFHLMRKIIESGLREKILELLEQKVWVGVSAGSMVTCPDLLLDLSQKLFYEDLTETENVQALSFVDFYVLPHLNSEWFLNVREEKIKQNMESVNKKLYALDDNCAIKVVDGKEEVVGNGKWFQI